VVVQGLDSCLLFCLACFAFLLRVLGFSVDLLWIYWRFLGFGWNTHIMMVGYGYLCMSTGASSLNHSSLSLCIYEYNQRPFINTFSCFHMLPSACKSSATRSILIPESVIQPQRKHFNASICLRLRCRSLFTPTRPIQGRGASFLNI
jgi:hypothetical protein